MKKIASPINFLGLFVAIIYVFLSCKNSPEMPQMEKKQEKVYCLDFGYFMSRILSNRIVRQDTFGECKPCEKLNKHVDSLIILFGEYRAGGQPFLIEKCFFDYKQKIDTITWIKKKAIENIHNACCAKFYLKSDTSMVEPLSELWFIEYDQIWFAEDRSGNASTFIYLFTDKSGINKCYSLTFPLKHGYIVYEKKGNHDGGGYLHNFGVEYQKLDENLHLLEKMVKRKAIPLREH